VVPGQDPPFGEPEQFGQHEADQAEQDDAAPHLRDGEAALELHDGKAQTVAGGEHLADHHEDDRDGQGLAHAGGDLRAGGRQDETAQAGEAGDSVRAGRVDQYAVHRADALHRVEQDGPDAAGHDDDHLHAVADAGEQHDHRDQHRRRDGPEELQDRLGGGAHPAVRADQHADADAQEHREQVAGGEPEQAG
jgi:hypothetical protein